MEQKSSNLELITFQLDHCVCSILSFSLTELFLSSGAAAFTNLVFHKIMFCSTQAGVPAECLHHPPLRNRSIAVCIIYEFYTDACSNMKRLKKSLPLSPRLPLARAAAAAAFEAPHPAETVVFDDFS